MIAAVFLNRQFEAFGKRPPWGFPLNQRIGRFIQGVFVALLATASSGCESSSPPPAPASPLVVQPTAKLRAEPKLEIIDVASLPAVGETSPPLDEGRVQVSLPEGWVRAPRSDSCLGGCLVRASPSYDARYSSVMLYVAPEADMDDVSKDNVTEFSEKVQSRLEADLTHSAAKLAENVHAVQIGDFYGVEYALKAKAGADSVRGLFLATASNGRQYTLETWVARGSIATYRPFARAIAASLKFEPKDSSAAEPPAP